MVVPDMPARATFGRSVRLFRLFRHEQCNPWRFYSEFANDSVAVLTNWGQLSGRTVLDVGGGPGYFARAFTAAGARYVGVELDAASDLPAAAHGLRGSGAALPIATASVDVAYCSNVLEHVRHPWQAADELVRVTRPGGIVFVSFTPWWSPWGGHETAPWHYLGGQRAARRYERTHGHPPKNLFGTSLYAHTVRAGLRWAHGNPRVEVLQAFPRYHPRWAWWIVRVPVLREVATWNLAMVLRRR